MISIDQARTIASKYVAEKQIHSALELVLVLEPLAEGDFGWAFGWTSKKFFETGCISAAPAGNSPIIIDREDGSTHVTGTALEIEYYVEKYKKQRKLYR